MEARLKSEAVSALRAYRIKRSLTSEPSSGLPVRLSDLVGFLEGVSTGKDVTGRQFIEPVDCVALILGPGDIEPVRGEHAAHAVFRKFLAMRKWWHIMYPSPLSLGGK